MATAAAGIAASRGSRRRSTKGEQLSARRQAAVKREHAEHEFVGALFAKHDKNQSGKLEQDQLRALMEELHPGVEVHEAEVRYVLKLADANDSNAVDKHELKVAMTVWMGLKEDQKFIDSRFEVYDSNRSGALERPQLEALLTDLNGGEAPAQSSVEWVIQRADEAKTGAIERDELRAAVALWYGHYAENAADEADGAQAEEEPASFGCCGLFGGSRGATVAPEP